MSLFDRTMLECLRQSAGCALQGTAVITRPVPTQDGLGVQEAFVPVGTVACFVGSRGKPMEIVDGGRVQAVIPFEVVLPANTDVRTPDRIEAGGHEYEVIGHNAGAIPSVLVVAICVRLEAGR